ncbi:MAG TPA: hypothetical protein VLG11_02150 [Candidatus Saccharimonadales bacterium]|nr:hypothetical protein [Candidatus Saccharimonadales bacterium]
MECPRLTACEATIEHIRLSRAALLACERATSALYEVVTPETPELLDNMNTPEDPVAAKVRARTEELMRVEARAATTHQTVMAIVAKFIETEACVTCPLSPFMQSDPLA